MANSAFDYNHLYDLYYKAGVNIERQRVASPFFVRHKRAEAVSCHRPEYLGKNDRAGQRVNLPVFTEDVL